MTPGSYLALRRGSAGMTRPMVDAQMGWQPGRMAEIEDKMRQVPAHVLEELHGVFPFDPIVARRLGEGSHARVCAGCGCSESDACWDEQRGGCHWVSAALCSDCRHQGVIG